MSTDKRNKNRSPLHLIVEFRPYQTSSDYTLGIMREISEEGFSFESELSGLQRGDRIEFHLKHPKSESIARGLGTIIWTKGVSYDSVIGIQFHEISDDDKEALLQLYALDKESDHFPFSGRDENSKSTIPEITTGLPPASEPPSVGISSVRTSRKTRSRRNKNRSFKPLVLTSIVIVTVLFLIYSEDIVNKTSRDQSVVIAPHTAEEKVLVNSADFQERDALPALNIPEREKSTQSARVPESPVSLIQEEEKRTEAMPDIVAKTIPPAPGYAKTVDNATGLKKEQSLQAEEQPPSSVREPVAQTAAKEEITDPLHETVSSSQTPQQSRKSIQAKKQHEPLQSAQQQETERISVTEPVQSLPRPTAASDSSTTEKAGPPPVSYRQINVYEETFRDNTNSWDEFETSIASARISEGKYHIRSKVSNGTYVILHHHDFPGDDDFDIEVHIHSDPMSTDAYYGFVFGAQDPINCYTFQTNGSGIFSIKKYTGAKAEELAQGSMGNAVGIINAASVLKVSKVQTSYMFSVNNKPVAKLSDLPFYGNKIGFVIEGQSAIAVDKTISRVKIR